MVYHREYDKAIPKGTKLMDNLKCACNNKKCNGVCRKENLFRERKKLNNCPAAYGDELYLRSKGKVDG